MAGQAKEEVAGQAGLQQQLKAASAARWPGVTSQQASPMLQTTKLEAFPSHVTHFSTLPHTRTPDQNVTPFSGPSFHLAGSRFHNPCVNVSRTEMVLD